MADSIKVDASAYRVYAAELIASSGTVGARSAAVVRKSAFDNERDQKLFVPVDTGNLRITISVSITGDGRHGSMSAEIGPTANYGDFVERGTSRMAPQPYVGPAFDRNLPPFISALEQVAQQALQGIA